ncbi:MAG: FAD-dependent oxidoreductase [Methanosarcinales archaeon]
MDKVSVMGRYDVIIIGGGISGLFSALILGKAGKRVLLLEKRESLGGNCNSYIVDGFQVDTGPHAITGLANGPIRQIIDEYLNYTPVFLDYGTYHLRTPDGIVRVPANITEFIGFDVIPRRDRLALSQAITKALTLSAFGIETTTQSVHDFLPKNLSTTTLAFVDAVCHFLSGKDMRKTSVHRVLAGSSFMSEPSGEKKNGSRLTEHVTDRISRLGRLATNKVSESQGYPRGGLKTLLNAVLYSMPPNVEIQTNQEVKRITTLDRVATGVETSEESFESSIVIHSGFAKELPEMVDELPPAYVSDLQRIDQTKSLTVWLGLTKEISEFNYIGSEIWFQEHPYWAMPISNYSQGIAPRGKQLIGFTFVMNEKRRLKDEKERAMDTITRAIPRIERFIEMEHYQTTTPEKAAVTIDGYIAENRTPIKNLYLVGTDADRRSMGITRAAYSTLHLIEEMKNDGHLDRRKE